MSQDINAQAQVAETSTQETKTFIRQVRTKTRRKYAPEDKIRIVLEGFRREVAISDLCRASVPGVYAWFFEDLPGSVPVGGCVTKDSLTLLRNGSARSLHTHCEN